MNLSGSRFSVSRLPGKGYPMKMIAGVEGVSTVWRLEKKIGLWKIKDKGDREVYCFPFTLSFRSVE